MKKSCVYVLMMLLSMIVAYGQELTVSPINQAPVIDGKLDDTAWKNATEIKDFIGFADRQKKNDISVKATCDNRWLYLGFTMKNPHMNLVKNGVNSRKGKGISNDESVEIFLDPGTGGKLYYHFLLNADNIQDERCFSAKDGANYGWMTAWRSATVRTDKGWTAEIAVPLSICVGYGNLNNTRINFLYNRINSGLDEYNALIGQSKEVFTWSHVEKTAHQPSNFAQLQGLGSLKIQAAFLPLMENASSGGFSVSCSKSFYPVNVTLRNFSGITGKIKLEITDKPEKGEPQITQKELSLPGQKLDTFTINIPVTDLSFRKVDVKMINPATGETLQTLTDIDTESLSMMSNVIASRNYYTTEEKGQVKCSLGLPAGELSGFKLQVEDEDGKIRGESDSLTPISIVDFSLDGLKPGVYNFKLALTTKEGKLIYKNSFDFRKLEPRPGCEVKIDRFKQVVLKDDKPFFPYGIMMHFTYAWHDEIMELMSKANFNLVMKLSAINSSSHNESDFPKAMEKHNLYLADWYGIEPAPQNLSDYRQKRDFSRRHYQRILPKLEEAIKRNMVSPQFVFHYNIDEPNLPDSEIRFMISKMFYHTAQELDPYHPVISLFARDFTNDKSAFTFQDILAFDIYTYPGWGGFHSNSVEQMARYTLELKQAANTHQKPFFVVPMLHGMEPVRTPIPLSQQEQRAQVYTAMIYGAKGLIFFSWTNLLSQEMWDTVSELGLEIKELAPSILNGELEQQITYSKKDVDVARQIFPDVHVRAFANPDGGVLLLAVNGKFCPVETEISLNGVNTTVTLPPMGTKAIRFEKANTSEAVRIHVKTTPNTKLNQLPADNKAFATTVSKQKNHMPNPVFARMTNSKILPDFMRPYMPMLPGIGTPESGWFIDSSNKWKDYPSFCLKWVEPFKNVKYSPTGYVDPSGKPVKATHMSAKYHSGAFFTYYAPQVTEPTPFVFSFYAKAAQDNTTLTIMHMHYREAKQTFTLTKDWQRYELKFDQKPYHAWVPGQMFLVYTSPQAQAWINGLQLEKGTQATEFTTK